MPLKYAKLTIGRGFWNSQWRLLPFAFLLEQLKGAFNFSRHGSGGTASFLVASKENEQKELHGEMVVILHVAG